MFKKRGSRDFLSELQAAEEEIEYKRFKESLKRRDQILKEYQEEGQELGSYFEKMRRN